MKLMIDRDQLLEALLRVQSVVEKKSTVQILSNILCTVKGKELSLSATDLEVGIRVTIPAEIREEGRITLSAKHFLDIVKELPAGKAVHLSRKKNEWVEILCEKSKFSIVSLPADEYPSMPAFEEKQYFPARVQALSEMIDRTSFAVSTDATRYHLNGVFFEHLGNSVMRMTATDGHRLSFSDQEVFLNMPEFKRGLILPRKGLAELRKLLALAEPSGISIAFDRGYFFAHVSADKDTYLFIRLIEGEYPDYRQVIPKAPGQVAKLPRDAFTSALRRVSLLAHEKSRGVKLALSKNLLEISSSNPDMGEAREEVEVEYSGEPLEIGFNAKYVLDCLPVIHSEQLELSFKDRLSPGLIQGVDQRNHTYVVMPMRI